MAQPKTKRTKNSDDIAVTSKYYVTNADLLPEVVKCKAAGVISNDLARMLMAIARKYGNSHSFYNYTYKEDMISEALASLCQNALKFDPEKSSNPFAFYTTCIYRTFLQVLGTEKKHRRIRDQLLVDMGENPSYSFSDEAKKHAEGGGEFTNELSELRTDIEEAKVRLLQEKLAEEKAAAEAAVLAAESTLLTGLIDDIDFIDEPISPNSLLEFDK